MGSLLQFFFLHPVALENLILQLQMDFKKTKSIFSNGINKHQHKKKKKERVKKSLCLSSFLLLPCLG